MARRMSGGLMKAKITRDCGENRFLRTNRDIACDKNVIFLNIRRAGKLKTS
jgi:hypothetical protein